MLTALLLAAAVHAAPAGPFEGDGLVRQPRPHQLRPAAVCRARSLARIKDTGERDPKSTASRKPKGQYAVIRTVDGCGVPTPMK